MSNLIRLNHSKIEYFRNTDGSLGYVWNFYSGCRHKEQGKCPPVPCWAEGMVGRFKEHYPDGFNPHFYPEAFLSPLALKGEGKRIGVCFMGDLFGDWVHPEERLILPSMPGRENWIDVISLKSLIFRVIEHCPQHTFVFLTKNPTGMKAWGNFPDNCEVGFSAWSPDIFIEGLREISKVEARVKWCSLEPLLEWSTEIAGNAWELLDWVAIGGLTGNKKQIMALAPKYPALLPMKLSARGNRWCLLPPLEYLRNIVAACDAAGTKIFLKDNIYKICMERPAEDHDLYWESMAELRQECDARSKGKLNGRRK